MSHIYRGFQIDKSKSRGCWKVRHLDSSGYFLTDFETFKEAKDFVNQASRKSIKTKREFTKRELLFIEEAIRSFRAACDDNGEKNTPWHKLEKKIMKILAERVKR